MTNALDIDNTQRKVQIATCVFALLGLLVPNSLVGHVLPIFGVLLILLGVPHGAGDYMLSKQLTNLSGTVFSPFKYILGYLFSMVSYIAIWAFEPLIAFGAFVLLSAYHFGQSNWANIHFPSKLVQVAIMLIWGLLIIGVPVLLHFDQAGIIISEIKVGDFQLSAITRAVLIFLLIFTNIGIIIHLNHAQILSSKEFKQEIGKILLLSMLFFTTPLLVGFGVYFVLWHSFEAMNHQVSLIKTIKPGYRMRDYLLQSLPLTLVSFTGLGMLLYFFGDAFNKGQNMGALFLFIAVITVPHAMLMEWLYRVRKPLNAKPLSVGSTSEQPT
jgi:Brp/Blh family beta-carotene 15,15'-monooxygenase